MPKHLNILFISLTLLLSIFLTLLYRHGSVYSGSYTRDNFTLLIVGDVMLGRSVNAGIVASHDYLWPFHQVKSTLSSADITLGNLETPLIDHCPLKRGGMVFCGEDDNAKGLKDAGFDYLTLANNHTLNQGVSGLQETIMSLSQVGLTPFGTSGTVYTKLGNTNVAFLGFDDVSHPLNPSFISQEISLAKSKADLVMIYYHWGVEYQSHSSARQQMLAHLSIDSGADLVIGAHPHVVQEHEIYKGKTIYYSLGNFVFDQEWSEATKHGLAIKLILKGNQVESITELPVLIRNYGQAYWQ